MGELPIQDATLRHSLQILRLSAGDQARVDAIMVELEGDLRSILQKGELTEAGRAQVKAIVVDARKAIEARYAAAAAQVDSHAIALIVAEKTALILADAIPASINTATAETLISLTKDVLIEGAPSSAWWVRQAEDTAFKFAAQLRQGVLNGETNESIVTRIVGRRGVPGIMETSRRNARALVHSSVMAAANDARLATFRKNGRLIKGVRWLATLDHHSCAICAALDGQSWDLDGEKLPDTRVDFRAPPAHWNCRCVLTPIPKSFADIGLDIGEPKDGTRASSLGPIHSKTTFDQFLKRQPAAVVNDMLGKGRAELWRTSKITTRDLVNGTGRELTLAELQDLT